MFVRCTVYEIWFFFILPFWCRSTFLFKNVVFEHLHNLDEGVSYLTFFCYRPVSLDETTKFIFFSLKNNKLWFVDCFWQNSISCNKLGFAIELKRRMRKFWTQTFRSLWEPISRYLNLLLSHYSKYLNLSF